MAAFGVNTYSPSDVILLIGGYPLAGWESISITRTQQGMRPVNGIRGKHTRVPSKDTSATISIALIQTSPSNDVLSEIHAQDLVNGTGRIDLVLKDMSGRSVFSSSEAYIIGYPETIFSGQFEYRAWSLFCQKTSTYLVGGNTRPQTSIVDAALSGLGSIVGNIF